MEARQLYLMDYATPAQRTEPKRQQYDCPICKDTGQLVGSYVFCFCSKGKAMERERYQDSALDQARTLASGTIATLTGLDRYEDIDKMRERFVAFIADDNPPNAFTCWQNAWDAFVERED